ncbi:uncharacterized protein RJT21DRAFT_54078 [Scheffersomyces amazonensis]|uniref:uncharacterized protein n=1 Tax=Scheffersomyces amazonensis TaxID=1078765 RepID=UPI00315D942C
MNFHPTDYLQDLNLDFDSSAPSNNVSPNFSSTDLDVFSQADFFALDVFSKDHIVPIKQQQSQQQPQQVQQQPQQSKPVTVKQEYESSLLTQAQELGLDFLDFNPAVPPAPANQIQAVIDESRHAVAEIAAHEDKRKRNTAASARFRIKKKLKEQEMEQKSRELQDRLVALEKKLKTLEMENKCLKNLILQQNEQKNTDLLESIKKRSMLDSKPVFQFTS